MQNRPITFLVVEDNLINTKNLERQLPGLKIARKDEKGLNPVAKLNFLSGTTGTKICPTVETALQLIANRKDTDPTIDFVISDNDLSDKKGVIRGIYLMKLFGYSFDQLAMEKAALFKGENSTIFTREDLINIYKVANYEVVLTNLQKMIMQRQEQKLHATALIAFTDLKNAAVAEKTIFEDLIRNEKILNSEKIVSSVIDFIKKHPSYVPPRPNPLILKREDSGKKLKTGKRIPASKTGLSSHTKKIELDRPQSQPLPFASTPTSTTSLDSTTPVTTSSDYGSFNITSSDTLKSPSPMGPIPEEYVAQSLMRSFSSPGSSSAMTSTSIHGSPSLENLSGTVTELNLSAKPKSSLASLSIIGNNKKRKESPTKNKPEEEPKEGLVMGPK